LGTQRRQGVKGTEEGKKVYNCFKEHSRRGEGGEQGLTEAAIADKAEQKRGKQGQKSRSLFGFENSARARKVAPFNKRKRKAVGGLGFKRKKKPRVIQTEFLEEGWGNEPRVIEKAKTTEKNSLDSRKRANKGYMAEKRKGSIRG